MSQNGRELAEWLRRDAMQHLPDLPPPPTVERPTIHYTELPEDTSDSPIAREWNFYRREVGRLLAEGHEGKWVLIKAERVIGIWETHEEADTVAVRDYLMQPVLIHQILTREPVLRGPMVFRLCRD